MSSPVSKPKPRLARRTFQRPADPPRPKISLLRDWGPALEHGLANCSPITRKFFFAGLLLLIPIIGLSVADLTFLAVTGKPLPINIPLI